MRLIQSVLVVSAASTLVLPACGDDDDVSTAEARRGGHDRRRGNDGGSGGDHSRRHRGRRDHPAQRAGRRRPRDLDRRDPGRGHRADRELLRGDAGGQRRGAAGRVWRPRRRGPPDAPRGTGPDIFTYAHDSLGNFVESGIVAPFDLSQIADQYQDVAVEAFTYKVRPTGCRMRSRTLPSSATPIWCRLHPPPSRARADRPPAEERRHRRGTARHPAGADGRPVPQLPDVLGRGRLRLRNQRTARSTRRTSASTRLAVSRLPSCGRSGRRRASCPARSRRTS